MKTDGERVGIISTSVESIFKFIFTLLIHACNTSYNCSPTYKSTDVCDGMNTKRPLVARARLLISERLGA
ncbi:hypothetical protein I4U23_016113 [Adineta vaga]|nr:hypothetical protein I4U23_016113 [Adineta vaga]